MMQTFIAFLRGINVGGHKKVSMADLRGLLTNSGFKNVETYIKCGNVIFQASEKASNLESNIQKLIYNHFGFNVSVNLKTNQQLQNILAICPFSEEKN